jgi:2',3'-cyclic-nucleotide 2'-phosphodiesterase (5'-nucleotidase family)
MKRLFGLIFFLMPFTIGAQEYSWKTVPMDGSRSKAVAQGTTKLKRSSSAAKVMKLVDQAQPAMARVKEVIGFSTEALSKDYPESGLSNWTVDTIMEKVEELSGKKVDVGFANFGGIRVDMPKGDILLDDILSMFPFKNNLVYLEHKGSTLRAIFEWMAEGRVQPVGGVNMVIEDGKLKTLLVGGQPLEDDKVYVVATNSFLLNGGDGFYLSKDAVNQVIYDELVQDAILENIKKRAASGKPFEYKTDGRVVIK